MSLTIGGSPITAPIYSFEPVPFRAERIGRTADASLVVDVIAVKHTYYLVFYQLDGTELAVWDALFNASNTTTFTYPLGGSTQTKTVWVKDMREKIIIESPETWQGIMITLEEV